MRHRAVLVLVQVWVLDGNVRDLTVAYNLLHPVEKLVAREAIAFAENFELGLQSLDLFLIIWLDFDLDAVEA